MQDINFIKAKAVAATQFLARKGTEVKLGIMLEVLARMEGYRNWSAYREQLAVTPAVSSPPTLRQALTMCFRWMSSAPLEELEAVESALGENAPMAMAAEALKNAGNPAPESNAAFAAKQGTPWSPVMGEMTDVQFAERKGSRCPSCGSYNLFGQSSLQYEGHTAWQRMCCLDCEAKWNEVYEMKLTGYDDFEGTIDHDAVKAVIEDVRTRAEKERFPLDTEAQVQRAVEDSSDELGLCDAGRKIAVMALTS